MRKNNVFGYFFFFVIAVVITNVIHNLITRISMNFKLSDLFSSVCIPFMMVSAFSIIAYRLLVKSYSSKSDTCIHAERKINIWICCLSLISTLVVPMVISVFLVRMYDHTSDQKVYFFGDVFNKSIIRPARAEGNFNFTVASKHFSYGGYGVDYKTGKSRHYAKVEKGGGQVVFITDSGEMVTWTDVYNYSYLYTHSHFQNPFKVMHITNVNSAALGYTKNIIIYNDGSIGIQSANPERYMPENKENDGITAYSPLLPRIIPGIPAVRKAVTYRELTFLLFENGAVGFWGKYYDGDNAAYERKEITNIEEIEDAISIKVFKDELIVLTEDGKLVQYPFAEYIKALCREDISGDISPVSIWSNEDRCVNIDVGMDVIVFMTEGGRVYTMGENQFGQLGRGAEIKKDVPIEVEIPLKAKDISTGNYHTLILLENKTVYSFGRNNRGQLGDGTLKNRDNPIQVPDVHNVTLIAAEEDFSVVYVCD